MTAQRQHVFRMIAAGVRTVLLAAFLAGALAGCACRSGYVGPYGGVHPARCWVW